MNHGPTFTAGFDPVNKLRPIFVVGTRPEAIKIFPVILAMREDNRLDPIVIASGQHPDMCYGKVGERPGADERIAEVPLPSTDPVIGSVRSFSSGK